MTVEYPILYTADSVRAYLEDRKTQTRRVMNPQPPRHWSIPPARFFQGHFNEWGCHVNSDSIRCPYGQAGDTLWVREKYALKPQYDLLSAKEIVEFYGIRKDIYYETLTKCFWAGKTRPSIHMPRWASRLTQTITGVKVERLADLTEEDARGEGVEPASYQTTHGWRNYVNPGCIATTARTSYESLWNKLNRQRGYGWESNVWVWVISYPKYSEEPTRTG